MHTILLDDATVARLRAINPDVPPETTALAIVLDVLDDDEAAHAAVRPFTPSEIKTLRSLRTMKVPPSQIAVSLGRPVGEVRDAIAEHCR